MTGELAARALSRRYGNTLALDGVDATIRRGEVHGLMGHNGAGKSTLLRLLTGADRPDSGAITIDGSEVRLARPADAHAAGIIAVYQELSLIENLTVSENLFLAGELTTAGRLDRAAMNRVADDLLAKYRIDATATTVLRDLPVASRQLIEVASALRRNVKYLLLDEPTTALSPTQIEELLQQLKRIATEENVGVVLVDHRLDEVFSVADRITALTDGRVLLSGSTAQVTRADVERAIIGHESEPTARAARSAAPASTGETLLSVRDIRSARLRGVSLEASAGRVLGIYGLVGSGRSRVLRAIFGEERLSGGEMVLGGHPYAPASPADAIRSGIAFVSEERKSDGFIPEFHPRENVTLPVLDRFQSAGILRLGRARAAAEEALGRVRIHGDLQQPIARLSGGNQQKVLLSRAMLQSPRVLLLDEPTKGIDIGTKAEIHDLIRELAHGGDRAVVLVSTEEEELLGVADDILVIRNGRSAGRLHRAEDLTVAELRRLALESPEAALAGV
ncbi:sugar ABC transporter ATP-binding protein [Galbitalea soli]|uniref:Sugar ABC transporter ATP-binding protein n=1 Tax=Galbitalea soli TaxID=1268042 RepID=A0A7C9TSC1_9MICO|nr:sugar ABC transporter ATP-binding protein [Galbitalea soli]NEM92558.1 sugar ABC transporter ATP-binding protein [Galbitalea soli]NYJ29595.1 ABC-type sugar transport system ATPase subunit [Galbitalea soli]